MADALFTINGDSSNQGYDAEPLEELTLALKTQPVSGVSTVRFQIWDANDFDPALDIVRNPPRKAKLSPSLLFDNGAATGSSLSPVTVDGEVTLTMPADRFHAWLVRCVVNGGMIALADGRAIPDPSLIHERMIVVKDVDGNRPIVATETTQYEDDGWAPQVGLAGAAGPTGPTGATGGAGPTGPSGPTGVGLTLIATRSTRLGHFPVGTTSFTTEASLPPGEFFVWYLHGAGGSGAAGCGRGSEAGTPGGSAGGGGAYHPPIELTRAQLIAMLPFDVVVEDGGAAAVCPTQTGGTNAQGANGNPGGKASLAGRWVAWGGGAGLTNTVTANARQSGGSGAGLGSAGNQSSTADVAGGLPGAGAIHTDGFGGAGAQSNADTVAGCTGGSACYGGGAGGGRGNAASVNGSPGGQSKFGGGGGGAGGNGVSNIGGNPKSGAAGGKSGSQPMSTAGGGGGTAGVAPAPGGGNGGNGGDGADSADERIHGGDGGGGGACGSFNGTVTGGSGGQGGFPGGGSGGGGAAQVTPGTGTKTGGPSKKGGSASVLVDCFA